MRFSCEFENVIHLFIPFFFFQAQLGELLLGTRAVAEIVSLKKEKPCFFSHLYIILS